MTDENKTERIHMLMSPSELSAIDDWRFENRVPTRSDAIRRLCQIGLSFDRQIHIESMGGIRDAMQATVAMIKSLKPEDADDPLWTDLFALLNRLAEVQMALSTHTMQAITLRHSRDLEAAMKEAEEIKKRVQATLDEARQGRRLDSP